MGFRSLPSFIGVAHSKILQLSSSADPVAFMVKLLINDLSYLKLSAAKWPMIPYSSE